MPTIQITKNYAVPGAEALQVSISRTKDTGIAYGGSDATITLNPAKACTNYVQNDANTADMVLSANHAQTNGTYDCFWTESNAAKVRYGLTGAITNTNDLNLDGGAGDSFPSSVDSGSLVVCKQKVVSTTIDGDNVSLMFAALQFGNQAATGRGHIAFQDTNSATVGVANISGVQNGTAIAEWDIEGGATNPITGNPVTASKVTHNDTTYTPTFILRGVQDSTP